MKLRIVHAAPFRDIGCTGLVMTPLLRTGPQIGLLIAAIVAISVFFLALPEVDLFVSGLFYDSGRGFVLAKNRDFAVFRRSGDIVVVVVALALVATLVVKVLRPDRPSLVPANLVAFLLASLAAGPGLLVNAVLKDHWGRPRPVMIEAFGGDRPYVEVWRITDQCARNCSFVAGEASSAIWLAVALTLVVPKDLRLLTAAAALVYAVLLSLNRIAFGGHFISDVLLSWTLTLLVMAILYRLMVASPSGEAAGRRFEEGLAALGRRLGAGRKAP